MPPADDVIATLKCKDGLTIDLTRRQTFRFKRIRSIFFRKKFDKNLNSLKIAKQVDIDLHKEGYHVRKEDMEVLLLCLDGKLENSNTRVKSLRSVDKLISELKIDSLRWQILENLSKAADQSELIENKRILRILKKRINTSNHKSKGSKKGKDEVVMPLVFDRKSFIDVTQVLFEVP